MQPGHGARQARRSKAPGKVTQKRPNSYYVLNDNPALTGTDIKNPQQSFDEGAGGTGAPNVTFDFTGHGAEGVAAERHPEIAQRGQEAQLPGVGPAKPRSSTSRSCSTAS